MQLNNNLYSRIFLWLFIGMLLTFGSGYLLSTNEQLMVTILAMGIIPIIIIELVIAILMGFRIKKMHPLTAKICYFLYSIVTGITFSTIFVTYDFTSLLSIFLISAIIFLALAIYGYFTKRNLSGFGTILFFSLLVTLIISLLNVFIFKSSLADTVLTVLGVLIFCGYIAYDMKQIKLIVQEVGEDKGAVYGAFQLYLDFINLFVRLLSLFGKEKD